MKQVFTIVPPLGGLDRSTALQHQPPFTSPDMLNVFPRDVFARRQRLGSRPGLAVPFRPQLGENSATGTLDSATDFEAFTQLNGLNDWDLYLGSGGSSGANTKFVFPESGNTYDLSILLNNTEGRRAIGVSGDATAEPVNSVVEVQRLFELFATATYNAGTGKTTIPASAAVLYPWMVGLPLTFAGTSNTYVISDVDSTSSCRVLGDASGESVGDDITLVLQTNKLIEPSALTGVRTTVVATASVFTQAMVGKTLRFNSSGNEYVIRSHPSPNPTSTTISVWGDASAETGDFTVSTTGSPTQMLIGLRSPEAVWLGGVLDHFAGTSISSNWTQASTLEWTKILPTVEGLVTDLQRQEGFVYLTNNDNAAVGTAPRPGGAIIHNAISDIASANVYTIAAKPHNSTIYPNGYMAIFAKLDNTTPDISEDGICFQIRQHMYSASPFNGYRQWSLYQVVGGVVTNLDAGNITISTYRDYLDFVGLMELVIDDANNTVTPYYNGVKLVSPLAFDSGLAGRRVGLGIVLSNPSGLNSMRLTWDLFRVNTTGSVANDQISRLMTAAAGRLYFQTADGVLTPYSGNLRLRSSGRVNAIERGGLLFIADHDEDAKAKYTGALTDNVECNDSNLGGGSAGLHHEGVDLTGLGIDTDDDCGVIYNAATSALNGAYPISAVATEGSGGTLGTIVTLTGLVTSPATLNVKCNYRIERAPKYWNPHTSTLALWLTTVGKGIMPTGCPLIMLYRDRALLAGQKDNPYVVYASRSGDLFDFDYGASFADQKRAWTSATSQAGIIAQPLTALINYHDEYAVFACERQLWGMRGDPAAGGTIYNISHTIGCIGANAHCATPTGVIPFLSRDGLYALPASGSGDPVPLSRGRLPKELINVNLATHQVEMGYDVYLGGVLCFIVNKISGVAEKHWFVQREGDDWIFLPIALPADMEPTALSSFPVTGGVGHVVLIGGRDGYIRNLDDAATTDAGTAIASYAVFGPIQLHSNEFEGMLMSLRPVLAQASGDVTWELFVADTPEEAVDAAMTGTAFDSGTWVAGLNTFDRPRARGHSCCLKISGTGVPWALERIDAQRRRAGRLR